MVHAQYGGYGSPLNLPKKISEANPRKAAIVRLKVTHDVAAPPNHHKPPYIRKLSRNTITLPPLCVYPPDLLSFLYKDVIDQFILTTLIDTNNINWCTAAKQLLPIQTTADGNCLLHAISLALWGVEDEELNLRKLLYRALTDNVEFVADMKRRWESERKKVDTVIAGDLQYRSEQWINEWTMMIRMAEPSRRAAAEDGLPYQCLDEFHIFVMANILRRPIIVAAENMWRGVDGRSLQPQNFGGIYLPLCWEPKDCIKTPVILAYHAMHFTPLLFQNSGSIGSFVSMTADAEYAFPIVKQDLTPMVVHFLLDQEERKVMELLPSYLNIKDLDYQGRGASQKIQAVIAKVEPLPVEMDLIPDFFQKAESQYHHYLDGEFGAEPSLPEVPPDDKKAARTGIRKCQMENCQSIGTFDDSFGICNDCLRKLQEQSIGPTQVSIHGRPVVCPTTSPQNPTPRPSHPKLPSYDEVVQQANPDRQPNGKPGYIPSILPVKCANRNCEYFCAVSTGKYCHACYNDVPKGNLKPPQPQFEPEGMICATVNCMNPGNHLTENLCKVCYDQKCYNNQGSAKPSAPPPSVISTVSQAEAAKASSAPLGMSRKPTSSSSASSSPLRASRQFSHEDERRSNSLPIILDDLQGPEKCLIPDCKLTGYPKFQGLCEGCYNQQTEVFREIKQTQPVKPASAVAGPVLADPQVKPKKRVLSEGAEGKLCLTRGCDMYGNVHTKGYCSQCYQTILTHSAVKPEPNFRMARRMEKCISPSCQRVGFNDYGGYCEVCHGGNAAAAGNVLGAEAPAAVTEHGGKKQPAKFKVQKHICVNPGCEGVRMVSDAAGGLCYWCHDKATRTIVHEQEGDREEEIPLAAPNNAEKCVNPNCDNQAMSADLKLCQRCINVLDATKEPPNEQKKKAVKKTASVPCANSECPNNREPGRQGFCKTCYHNYLEGGPREPPAPRPARQPGFDHEYPPKANRPKCQAPWGCDMFGDPDNKNLCSKCFQRSLIEKYKHPSAAQANPRAYDEPWGYRNRQCATIGCLNVGNMNILDGLCDECYCVYQDIRRVPRYALLRDLREEPAPAPKVDRALCKYQACDHFGNPKCFGYCHECYEVLMVNAPDRLVPERLKQMQI